MALDLSGLSPPPFTNMEPRAASLTRQLYKATDLNDAVALGGDLHDIIDEMAERISLLETRLFMALDITDVLSQYTTYTQMLPDSKGVNKWCCENLTGGRS